MKTVNMALALVLTLVLGQSAFAEEARKEQLLANSGDFVVVSDVNSPTFTIFLSYTGTRFGHCGIALRTHSLGVHADALHAALDITTVGGTQDIATIENGKLVASVPSPQQTTYGAFFAIKTKSGRPLNEVIAGLDSFTQAEVIVEILPCKY